MDQILADVHPLADRPPPERSHDRSPPDPVDLFGPGLGPLLVHYAIVQPVCQPEPSGRSPASPRFWVLDNHHVRGQVACDPSFTQRRRIRTEFEQKVGKTDSLGDFQSDWQGIDRLRCSFQKGRSVRYPRHPPL
jgi:hypothetical protein